MLADVRSGVTKGRKLGSKEIVEVPYLRVANVQDGYLDLSEIQTIKVLPEDLDKYRLEDGDILMTGEEIQTNLGGGVFGEVKSKAAFIKTMCSASELTDHTLFQNILQPSYELNMPRSIFFVAPSA